MADNSGAGGLIEEISGRKVRMRYAYLLILLVSVKLSVFAVLALASLLVFALGLPSE